MTLFGSVDSQVAGNRPQAIQRDRLECVSYSPIARTLERNQVCFRAAARQHAKALRSVTNKLAQPAHDARFDHCCGGTVAPRARVLVQRGRQRIGPDTDRQWCGIKLAVITRARHLHRMRQNVFRKLCQDLLGCYSLFGKWFVEYFLQLLWRSS